MYCRHCDKIVVCYSVAHGAASGAQLEALRRRLAHEGKVILFNPPPLGPYRCPNCRRELATGAPPAPPPGGRELGDV